MASLRRVKKSRYWIATLRGSDGRSTCRSTGVIHGGPKEERGTNRRKALEVAQGFEDLLRGQSTTEAKVRKTAYELASKANFQAITEINVSEFFESYLDFKRISVAGTSITRYEGVVKKFLASIPENKLKAPIDSIGVEHIEGFIKFRSDKGVTAKTILNDLKNLNPAFTRAISRRQLETNPIKEVDFEESESLQRLPFEVIEVCTILDRLRNDDLELETDQIDWLVAITIGYFTGMRLGDCCNRKWEDFDFDRGVVTYIAEKTRATQGKKSPLSIPLHPELVVVLKGLNRNMKGELTPSLSDGKGRSNRSWLSKLFMKILESAGVDPMPIKNSVSNRIFHQKSFHSLRATCNSNMANAGVNQEVRMRIVGHASKHVNDGYTHIAANKLAEAVGKIPSLSNV